MGESRSEGCSIDGAPSSGSGGMMSGASCADGWGLVGVLAFGAEGFDGVDADFVAEAHGEDGVAVALD